MGNGFPLTDQQWDELDQLRFGSGSATVFRNCLIIQMTSQRWTIPATAEFLRCGTDTVKRIRRQYRRHGLAGLIPGHSPGRPAEATPEFLQHLRTAVQTQPLTLGYGFTTWSVPRLAAHLAKQTGIRFSVTHLRRLLHQEDFSVHRPKHTMKGKRDEVAYGKARKRLQRLKKKP